MFWIALWPRPDAPDAPDAAVVALPQDATAALGWWALQFTPRVAQLGQAVLLEGAPAFAVALSDSTSTPSI